MQLVSFKNLYTRLFTDTLARFLCGPSSKLHLLVIASGSETRPETADKWLMAFC